MGGLALAGTMMVTGAVGFAQQETTPGQNGPSGIERRGKGMRGMRGGFAGHFARNLNLTDAQKQQMQQIAARYRESEKALRSQAGAQADDRGFDALNGGAFDEAAVRAAAQTRANAQVEVEVARSRMMSEFYALLTPEQKTQLATERQQHEQKRQEWRARRQGNARRISK
ncbi:MAG: Spy/CpxP family protein refolding chaperone [Pyrinomonadaceae bacterium]